MSLNTVQLSLLTSCIQRRLNVYFFRPVWAAMGALTLSDDKNKPRFDWRQTIGVGLTVVSLSVGVVQYITKVDQKAETALAQIADIKASQRQSTVDNRDDLRVLNAKVDQILLRLPNSGR